MIFQGKKVHCNRLCDSELLQSLEHELIADCLVLLHTCTIPLYLYNLRSSVTVSQTEPRAEQH